MATHDYVLANASGAAFRTDLNNALAAIVSNNSNSSSPATTYAYQWWADTSAGVLKIRNSANNAWVELLQLDGTLTLEDGAVGTPALAFRDDLDTGIFSSDANKFNVATGGVERMELGATTIFNEDGADVDFRIEGDTEANLFYVDAGNNRIGIGIATPQTLMHLHGASARFQFTDSTTGTGASDGVIAGLNGDQDFFINNRETSKNILLFTGGSVRLEVQSDGSVGIGTGTDPVDRKLHVKSAGLIAKLESTSANSLIAFATPTNEAAGTMPNIGANDNDFEVTTGNVTTLQCFSGGDVEVSRGNLVVGTAGKGIDFSATGNSAGSMSSELLHDYEKGSWTPIFTDDGTSGNSASSYTRQLGWYCRVGDLVNIQLRLSNIVFSGFNTSHAAYIKNLPFPVQGDSGRLVTGTLMLSEVNLDSDTMSLGVLANVGSGTSNSFFRLFQSKDNAVWASIPVSSFTSGSNEIMVNMSYLTDG